MTISYIKNVILKASVIEFRPEGQYKLIADLPGCTVTMDRDQMADLQDKSINWSVLITSSDKGLNYHIHSSIYSEPEPELPEITL